MTKRKYYRAPGWEDRRVSWSYSVAFKKPRGHKLYWVGTDSQDVSEASRQASRWMEENYPRDDYKDWLEYGISKTFWRHWGQYDEPITQDEYEFALERAKALAYLNKAGSEEGARRQAKKDGLSISDGAWESAWWVSNILHQA